MKFHVKKGDVVVVASGTQKGKRGKILAVLPQKQRVIIEGVKLISKHLRKSQDRPQGGIVQQEGTIHISNVMKAEKYDSRRARSREEIPAQQPEREKQEAGR